MRGNPGWQREPARHALAAKGVRTVHRPVDRTIPEYVELPVTINPRMAVKERQLMYERMSAVMDQLDYVWDDIDAPLYPPQNLVNTPYSQQHARVQDTVSEMRALAYDNTVVDELYQHEAEANLKELVRLSTILDDHGRYLVRMYPKVRSEVFGGSLGEHIRNNAAYFKMVSEQMLRDIEKR